MTQETNQDLTLLITDHSSVMDSWYIPSVHGGVFKTCCMLPAPPAPKPVDFLLNNTSHSKRIQIEKGILKLAPSRMDDGFTLPLQFLNILPASALLQNMAMGLERAALPTTKHSEALPSQEPPGSPEHRH